MNRSMRENVSLRDHVSPVEHERLPQLAIVTLQHRGSRDYIKPMGPRGPRDYIDPMGPDEADSVAMRPRRSRLRRAAAP